MAAPASAESYVTLTALGKKIGWVREYFDGAAGGEESSFSPPSPKTGKELDDARLSSDFYDLANWRTLYKTVEIKRIAKVGDEEAYVVVETPEKGNPVTDYVSTKSFLVLQRDRLVSSSTSNVSLPHTEVYSDYRSVDGWMMPFTIKQTQVGMGDTVIRFKEITFDVEIPASAFKPGRK
jgi:hypothetical protein